MALRYISLALSNWTGLRSLWGLNLGRQLYVQNVPLWILQAASNTAANSKWFQFVYDSERNLPKMLFHAPKLFYEFSPTCWYSYLIFKVRRDHVSAVMRTTNCAPRSDGAPVHFPCTIQLNRTKNFSFINTKNCCLTLDWSIEMANVDVRNNHAYFKSTNWKKL